MLRITNVSFQKKNRELECTVTEFVVEEERCSLDHWMLASTRTTPYYWLLHAIAMVSIVCDCI